MESPQAKGLTLNARALPLADFANPAIDAIRPKRRSSGFNISSVDWVPSTSADCAVHPHTSHTSHISRTLQIRRLNNWSWFPLSFKSTRYPLLCWPFSFGAMALGIGCRGLSHLPLNRNAASYVRLHLCCLFPITDDDPKQPVTPSLTLKLGRANFADFKQEA